MALPLVCIEVRAIRVSGRMRVLGHRDRKRRLADGLSRRARIGRTARTTPARRCVAETMWEGKLRNAAVRFLLCQALVGS